jgi:hypothetical protein
VSAPYAIVDALTKLGDQRPEVQLATDIAMTRKTLDLAEGTMLTLLSSLQPHLGARVDVRV